MSTRSIITHTTGALAPNSTPQHSTDPNANSPFAIAIDSGGDALFIADQAHRRGLVVLYRSYDRRTGALTPYSTFPNSSTSDAPVGVGIGVNADGIEYLFTANSGTASVSSFTVTSQVIVNSPPTLVTGYTGATGLVVDPQNMFVYTANFWQRHRRAGNY